MLVAHWALGLPEPLVLATGLSAILGHAFSPILRFKGGKAIAVTLGVLFALPRHDPLLAFAAFTVLGLLLIDDHSWTVMLGFLGSVTYLVVAEGATWHTLFMAAVLVLMAFTHRRDLRVVPRPRTLLVGWLRGGSRR